MDKKFHGSIGRGDIQAVSSLYSRNKLLLEAKYKGKTPIFKAIQSNKYNIVSFLIDEGVNLKQKSTFDYTPFHFSLICALNRTDFDINIIFILFNRTRFSKYISVKVLLDFIRFLNNYNNDYENMVYYLIKRVNVNETINNKTALMVALEQGKCSHFILDTLLSNGANVWSYHLKDLNKNDPSIVEKLLYHRISIIKYLMNKVLYGNYKIHNNKIFRLKDANTLRKVPDEVWRIIYEFV